MKMASKLLVCLSLAATLQGGPANAQDQTKPGAGNAAAINLSDKSPLVKSAHQFLIGQAQRIQNGALREQTLEILRPMPQAIAADQRYQVRHGLGYTCFDIDFPGLSAETTICVATEEPVKIIRVALVNHHHESSEHMNAQPHRPQCADRGIGRRREFAPADQAFDVGSLDIVLQGECQKTCRPDRLKQAHAAAVIPARSDSKCHLESIER